MTVVIGTAGHIDHGKTTLLRALTGIDADRLPEERRRGMTIDVGYAFLDLPDGTSVDFVDVPGHDALVGNMLVGAGEIDAAMLVVAADDGVRAQTIEHLALLDALGIREGIAVVTKADVAGEERTAAIADQVRTLLARSSLAGAPVLAVASPSGAGIAAVREAVIGLRDRVTARLLLAPDGPRRLAIDRGFAIRGRGAVATGSLRGGTLRTGEALRVQPGGLEVRVRGLQVHHAAVDPAETGRTAVNLAGAELEQLPRGAVLTSDDAVVVTDRLLVALTRPMDPGAAWHRSGAPAWPPRDGTVVRLHLGTAAVDAAVGRRGREAVELPDGSVTALLRLAGLVAAVRGDRAVLRRPSPGDVVAGVRVLDPRPARGVSRRRATPERLATLSISVAEADANAAADAIVALHGAEAAGRVLVLAPDVRDALERAALDLVAAHHRERPLGAGMPLTALRYGLRGVLRRLATIDRDDLPAADLAIGGLLDDLVLRRRLARDADRLRDPARPAGPGAETAAAMDRLEALLAVSAPPPLAEAARAAGCPPDGIRALEAAGRIVRVDADLAWATREFHRLGAIALGMARRGPLSPAAFRDATASSRRTVMPFLEDLGRRGILERTPEGHVPGPRAPREPARGAGAG
jgi:selenocysteine-specific elongation factor